MLKIDGEYARIFSGRFKSINISCFHSDVPAVDDAICFGEFDLAYEILRRGCDSCRTVRICIYAGNRDRYTNLRLLKVLSETNADIEVYTYTSLNLSAFWKSIGKRVKKLEIWWKQTESTLWPEWDNQDWMDREEENVARTWQSICLHCTTIERLTIGDTNRFISVSFFAEVNTLKSLGRTLEVLVMKSIEWSEREFPSINKYCRNLKHIVIVKHGNDDAYLENFGHESEGDEIIDLSDCLASYRANLSM